MEITRQKWVERPLKQISDAHVKSIKWASTFTMFTGRCTTKISKSTILEFRHKNCHILYRFLELNCQKIPNKKGYVLSAIILLNTRILDSIFQADLFSFDLTHICTVINGDLVKHYLCQLVNYKYIIFDNNVVLLNPNRNTTVLLIITIKQKL